jgi:nucleotide-binding universal stress UspA family protein
VRTEVVTADPRSVADAILEFESGNDVDVIAMSTRGAGGLRRFLLGSVADKILRASPGPVLLFRPGSR